MVTMPRQIHSCDVVLCTKYLWYANVTADALVSDSVAIWVWWSDCNLIAILGNKRYVVCHAWRKGLSQGILQHSIDILIWLGEQTIDLQMILWPSIRYCCFEIGRDLIWLRDGYVHIREGKRYVDMVWYIHNIATQYSIARDHIYDYGSCTKCNPQKWRSHRNGDLLNQMLRVKKIIL